MVSLSSTLVLVLAVTATLNHQYGWYSSWSDLFGSFTNQQLHVTETRYGAKQTHAASHYNLAAAQKINDTADREYAATRAQYTKTLNLHETPDGVWVKITIPGLNVQGKDIGRAMVWLPPSYLSHPERSYPVIEAFHGMPGGTLDYERVFRLDHSLMASASDDRIRDAIIVVPQEMPNGVDTECVNGGGVQMETWLTSTVPNYMIEHFRTQADPHSWMAFGVSAGGWCAAMAGVLHPERYAAVVVLGGYFTPDFSAAWNPFAQTGIPARYDLTAQVAAHPAHRGFWVLIPGADHLSGPASKKFAEAVKAPDSLTAANYPDAGHRIEVWEQAFPRVWQWAGKEFPAFAAHAETSSAYLIPVSARYALPATSSTPSSSPAPTRLSESAGSSDAADSHAPGPSSSRSSLAPALHPTASRRP